MSCGCRKSCGCGNEEGGRQRFNPCERAIHGMKHDANALAREVEALAGTITDLNKRIADAEANCVYADDDDDDDCGCRPRPCGCNCGCKPRPCGCNCGCRPHPCGCNCGCQRPQPRCGC